MADTGLLNCNTGTSTVAVGTKTWSNPDRITTSNDLRAQAACATSDSQTYRLDGTNFGFAIPAGSTIDGIKVTLECNSSASFMTVFMRLLMAGSWVGSDKADFVDWSTSGDTTRTYGGATDTWGLTLTAADVNSSTFGVGLVGQNNGYPFAAHTGRVDNVKMQIFYTPGAASSGQVFWHMP